MTNKERQKIATRTMRYGNVTLLGMKVNSRDVRLLRELGVETIDEGLGTKFVEKKEKR